MIKEDNNLPRNRWKKGIVDELITGTDGNVRGAKLRVYHEGRISYIQRPIQRLIPFELYNNVKNLNNVCNDDYVAENREAPNSQDEENVRTYDNTVVNVRDNRRPKRAAALTGIMKRRLMEYE